MTLCCGAPLVWDGGDVGGLLACSGLTTGDSDRTGTGTSARGADGGPDAIGVGPRGGDAGGGGGGGDGGTIPAGAVVWPTNRHHYLAVKGSFTWTAANAAAQAAGGHLVTLSSLDENNFVFGPPAGLSGSARSSQTRPRLPPPAVGPG
jgi:hypothetical protein